MGVEVTSADENNSSAGGSDGRALLAKSAAASVWPDYMPPGCPDAQPTHTGRLFRLVSKVPVRKEDPLMLPAALTGAFPDADACLRASLSSSSRIEELQTLRLSRTKKYGRARVVAIDMLPDLGRARPTPSRSSPYHWSLWLTLAAFDAASRLFIEVPS